MSPNRYGSTVEQGGYGRARLQIFKREYKYGCHNYKPVPVAIARGKGENTMFSKM